MRSINEQYHDTDKLQKRILDENNFTYRNITPYLSKYFKNCGNILDIGCGTGTLDFFLTKLNNTIDGLDDSKRAIDIARINANNFNLKKEIKYFVKNIENFKTTKKYNGILMIEVLEHIKHDLKIICYANTILKKNGILLLSTRKLNSPLHNLHLTKSHDAKVGHIRRYNSKDLKKIFKLANFKIIKLEETEGLLSDFLFSYPLVGNVIIKIANKVSIFNKILSILDKISKQTFGSSQIIIFGQKK